MEEFLSYLTIYVVLGLVLYLIDWSFFKRPTEQRQQRLFRFGVSGLGLLALHGLDRVFPGTGNLLVGWFLLAMVWFFLDMIVLPLVIKTVKQRRPWQLVLRVLVGLAGAAILYTYFT